jgi:anti-sigma B factor antagonist
MAELNSATATAEVTVTDEDGHPVVSIEGELDLSTTEVVWAAVHEVLVRQPGRVVFDLGRLAFMDSSGIALLVRVAQRVPDVELRNPSQIVRRLIELTGLAETLRIFP